MASKMREQGSSKASIISLEVTVKVWGNPVIREKRTRFGVANLVWALVSFGIFMAVGLTGHYMAVGEFVTAELALSCLRRDRLMVPACIPSSESRLLPVP